MKKIIFNEFNLLMGSGGVAYLPLVSGILSSYIKSSEKIRSKVEVQPFLFKPDLVENLLTSYNNPSVAAFSIAMWNENLSLKLAEQVKLLWPECLIVFGGAQCPHQATDYMIKNPFIDICIRAEGEEAFFSIINNVVDSCDDFSGIVNTTYRKNNKIYVNANKPEYSKNLDIFPSPYLSGEYDYLLKNKKHNYQAIIETNRGCPFLCTYCYWGRGGNTNKYKFHSLERVFAEIEYFAKSKIEYVFNADSNFGMHKRDMEIAENLVKFNKNTGYPRKFRTCWGKNTSSRIFKIASLLNYNGMDKGITLARQSNSKDVLRNVKRDNIKLEAYTELEKSFNKLNVPIYAEMILGLPGESYETWKDGIEDLISSGINNQIMIYQAEVYPNTELGERDYQKKFNIKTKRIKLNEIHCSPRKQEWLNEYQEIVVQTNTMSVDDWKKMNIFSIVTMLFYSMKLCYYVLLYLNDRHSLSYTELIEYVITNRNKTTIIKTEVELYINHVNKLLNGEGRGVLFEEYSDTYLEIEEVSFLKITKNIELFFNDIYKLFKNMISTDYHDEFREVVIFQKSLVPFFSNIDEKTIVKFSYNLPEYLYENLKMKKNESNFTVYRKGYDSKYEFAKKKLIWARKSGDILNETDYTIKLLNKKKLEFNINDDLYDTHKVSLFSESNKFEKYNSM